MFVAEQELLMDGSAIVFDLVSGIYGRRLFFLRK
jgi:hypothetical protein